MFEAVIAGYRWFFLQLADFVGIGWGIVALSFITSAAMMPLMKAVAGIVKRESEYQSVILPQLAQIKSKFSTDAERHMHIQRLYARYGYSPLSAVKKVLPLFVQIPFLLLTYYMLKGTAEINGVSFLFLRDLGSPDALLAAFAVNVLPLVMTAINILTVYATPGFTTKDQCQAVGISLLFLVLLYTAPSALLLYWTLNNAITCVRTLVGRRCEGSRLLMSRLHSIGNVRSAVRSVAKPKVCAIISLSLFVLTLYLSVFVKLTNNVIDGGLNLSIALKSMVYICAMYSFSTIPLVAKRSAVSICCLVFSLVFNVGFSVLLACLYLFSRFNFVRMLSWLDMCAVVWCLLTVATIPLLVGGKVRLMTIVKDSFASMLHLISFMMLPIIFAIHYAFSSNVFTLPFTSICILSLYLTGACVTLYAILMLAYREWVDSDTLFKISFGVLAAICLFPIIVGTGIFSYTKNLPIRLVLLVAIPLLLLRIRKQAVVTVFLLALFVSVIVSSGLNHGKDLSVGDKAAVDISDRIHKVMGDAQCLKSNNVYLLIYDSYAHKSVIDGLSLEDRSMFDELEENGFTIYDAYSLGADTITSMSSMFTIGGVTGMSQKATMGGDNVFSDFLREAGYETSVLLCGYDMPIRGERMPADFYYPTPAKIARPENVLLPSIFRGTLSQSPNVFNSYTHEDWMRAFYGVMSRRPNKRCFVYAHNDYPAHAAWEPRFRKSDKEEQRAYSERLQKANKDIREMLQIIRQDRDAIVIVASDHGASMLIPEDGKYDMRHLIDHYGILLAIRWPEDYKPVLQLNCLQNVLLEVMIYLSGDEGLTRLENPGETVALEHPIGAPKGLIKHGVLQSGKFAGKSIFGAAKITFEGFKNR